MKNTSMEEQLLAQAMKDYLSAGETSSEDKELMDALKLLSQSAADLETYGYTKEAEVITKLLEKVSVENG